MPLCQWERFELLYYPYKTQKKRKLKITIYCMQLWNCLSSRSIDSSKEIEMIKTLKEHSKQLDHLATTIPKVSLLYRISIAHYDIWNLIYTIFVQVTLDMEMAKRVISRTTESSTRLKRRADVVSM